MKIFLWVLFVAAVIGGFVGGEMMDTSFSITGVVVGGVGTGAVLLGLGAYFDAQEKKKPEKLTPEMRAVFDRMITGKSTPTKTEVTNAKQEYLKTLQRQKPPHAKNRNQEVADALAALDAVRPQFKDGDVYGSIAVDKVFQEARAIISKDKESTVHSISVDKWKPSDLALLIVSKVSGNILSSGECHIYRGTLSGEGHGHLAVFRRAVQELAKSGFITQQEAEQDVIQIQKNIKEVG